MSADNFAYQGMPKITMFFPPDKALLYLKSTMKCETMGFEPLIEENFEYMQIRADFQVWCKGGKADYKMRTLFPA